jgi:hypothetical protein
VSDALLLASIFYLVIRLGDTAPEFRWNGAHADHGPGFPARSSARVTVRLGNPLCFDSYGDSLARTTQARRTEGIGVNKLIAMGVLLAVDEAGKLRLSPSKRLKKPVGTENLGFGRQASLLRPPQTLLRFAFLAGSFRWAAGRKKSSATSISTWGMRRRFPTSFLAIRFLSPCRRDDVFHRRALQGSSR